MKGIPRGGRGLSGLLLLVCVAVGHTEVFLEAPIIEVSTCAGSGAYGSVDGRWDAAQFDTPQSLSVSPNGEWLVVAGYETARSATSTSQRARKVTVASGAVTTLSGTHRGSNDGPASEARFNTPHGLAFHPSGSHIYVADSGNHVIRRVDAATGEASTVAGVSGTEGLRDGAGAAALFKDPRGVSVSPDGGWLAVADTGNNAVRRIVISSGEVSLVAGGKPFSDYVDDAGTMARFSAPEDVSVSPGGGLVLVADSANHRVRLLEWRTGVVSTLAGNGTTAPTDGPQGNTSGFSTPLGVAFGPGGGWAAVSDSGNHLIRNISASWPPEPTPVSDPYTGYSTVLNLTASSGCPPRVL
eukprot:CAMPEP_0174917296 /NCGR_PEP_ID=MMETSP1355-20121228/2363_1 /TAXON_ID=464990 /ORGANISM="Hemiselmis tepida, Strain CCMP443" /LENGTH=354 /DNA_ID=CAMNT_0016162371 /DNA_START=21 /DNA_END=1083 /DNA_ORIENTATION=+